MTQKTHHDVDAMIRRLRDGDQRAFEGIVRRFERAIRAFAISRCPPGGDADDVAQRVFVEAFKNIERYEPGTDFRAWLFAIARNQLMRECTRLKRLADYHSRYAPHALMVELERRAERGAEDVDHRIEFLRGCVAGLNESARTMLRWRYDEGAPLAEIAERSGRSVGAIKKQMFILRQKLHDCIADKLAEETV